MLDDKTEVTGELGKAEAFSNHFKSIFTSHSLCSFPTSNLIGGNVLSHIILSSQEVVLKLEELNVNKAMGSDKIPARLLVRFGKLFASYAMLMRPKKTETAFHGC